jgi:hypothetical protein
MSTRSQSAGTPHGRVAGIAESTADVSDVWVGEIRSRSVIQFATQALQIASLGRMISLGGSADEHTEWMSARICLGTPRVFRTAELELFHAARCRFWYSSWTSCGVRYPSAE